MQRLHLIGGLFFTIICCLSACTPAQSPEQKQLAVDLQEDLSRIRQEIERANEDYAAYSGGLIKTMIGVRLEILKTSEALVEQRIHAVGSNARIKIVVNATEVDSVKADELAKEIETQKIRVADARKEADRYSGGLVQALAESNVATARNTLALLEQQYVIAKYGLAITPAPSGSDPPSKIGTKATSTKSMVAPPPSTSSSAGDIDCLKIETFDSSVLDANDTFTELAWKVDVLNSCNQPFRVRVTFTIYDKDEFELDSDYEDVLVPAKGVGKVRGKMLISPPEKAIRMARQGARISLR